MELCEHSLASRLTQPGEYGFDEPTDWWWCPNCGSVTRSKGVWSKPAYAVLMKKLFEDINAAVRP